MNPLCGAVIGCGFFAQNHLSAWQDLAAQGAPVAIAMLCDLDPSKARAAAARHHIAEHTHRVEDVMARADIDFVDIVTHVSSHEALVLQAALHGKHVICQKPFAPDLRAARRMMRACEAAGVSLTVHENFRFQPALRALAAQAPRLGRLHFGRVSFRSGHDVYAAQPYLARDARFIMSDVGVHTFDLARWLVGEVSQVACHTQRVNPSIQGEDVATALLGMASGATVVVDMSYASRLDPDPFPQALVWLEGQHGSAVLDSGFRLGLTLHGRTQWSEPFKAWPAWGRPPFHAVQASVLDFQRHWLEAQHGARPAETCAADNIETLRLTEAAYTAAAHGTVIRMDGFDPA